MKKNIVDKLNLHNVFTLEVHDSRTGKLKQVGKAYNIIVNGAFNRLCDAYGLNNTENGNYPERIQGHPVMGNDVVTTQDGYGQDTRFGPFIFVGSGTGEISPTRTTLFTYESNKRSEYHDHGYNAETLTGYHTKKAVWNAGELTGKTIREIGYSARSASGYLSSHAMIEDAEGEPIGIEIGEFDVLTVYGKVIVELALDYDNAIFVKNKKIPGLLAWFVCNGTWALAVVTSINQLDHVYAAGSSWKEGDDDVDYVDTFINGVVKNPPTITIDKPNKKVVVTTRINTNELNVPCGIRELGIGRAIGTVFNIPNEISVYKRGAGNRTHIGIARIVLPSSDLFNGHSIENEEVATGDGETTEFNLNWNNAVANSEVITVNSIEQTRDTDYTIHYGVGTKAGKNNVLQHAIVSSPYEVNPKVSGSVFQWASEVIFGNTANYFTINGLSMSGSNVTGNQTMVIFELERVNTINKLRLYQHITNSSRLVNFKFQGSTNNADWVDIVSNSLRSTVGWDEFNFSPVAYKYYRLQVLSTGGNSGIQINQIEALSCVPHIVFEESSIPANGHAIIASYDVPYIPKDTNHVLDINYTLQFGDGNA